MTKYFAKYSTTALAAAFLAFSANGPAFAADKTQITFGTASPTGGYMQLGTAISRIVNENLPDYNLTPVPEPRTSVGNVIAIHQKKREFGLATANIAYAGYEGEAPFKEPQNVRAMFGAHSGVWHIFAREDSGIKTLTDLKGKKVAVGTPKSTNEVLARRVFLPAAGLSLSDIKPEFVGLGEAVQLMKDGHVDALSFIVVPPLASVADLANTRELRAIIPTAEEAKKIAELAPFLYPFDMPKTAYPSVKSGDGPISVFAVRHIVICRADLPEQLVYEATKAIFANLDVVHKTHKRFSVITRKNAIRGLPIPLHPGADKYFAEN